MEVLCLFSDAIVTGVLEAALDASLAGTLVAWQQVSAFAGDDDIRRDSYRMSSERVDRRSKLDGPSSFVA